MELIEVDRTRSRRVLGKLCSSGVPFEAVADLCEMSARKDPALKQIAAPGTQIVACYPRAVKWLFHAAGTPLPEGEIEVLNMREQSAEEILSRIDLGDPRISEERNTKESVG